MNYRLVPSITLFAALASLAGCGSKGPTTHAVRGKIELAGGDVSVLAGSHVEAALTSNPTIRASGVIEPDGQFILESIHGGELRNGAVEGTYQVRLVLSDEDRATRRRAGAALARRYLDFKTSGLTLEVPARSEVQFTVAAR